MKKFLNPIGDEFSIDEKLVTSARQSNNPDHYVDLVIGRRGLQVAEKQEKDKEPVKKDLNEVVSEIPALDLELIDMDDRPLFLASKEITQVSKGRATWNKETKEGSNKFEEQETTEIICGEVAYLVKDKVNAVLKAIN